MNAHLGIMQQGQFSNVNLRNAEREHLEQAITVNIFADSPSEEFQAHDKCTQLGKALGFPGTPERRTARNGATFFTVSKRPKFDNTVFEEKLALAQSLSK